MSDRDDRYAELVPSPDYGTGMVRRRIRLTAGAGHVLAELEDHAHAMRCRVHHDGERITAIDSEFLRIPMTTCASAGDPLAEMIGHELRAGTKAFFANGRARRNCTHMFDLVWLAGAHALRDAPVRQYDIEIPDEQDGRTVAMVLRDGEHVMEWHLDGTMITGPEPFAGRDLYRGLISWAMENFPEEQLEAILMLQKGCLVTSARKYLLIPGRMSAGEMEGFVGICHGFGPERIASAERNAGTVQDFTDRPDDLLRFLARPAAPDVVN